MQTTDQDRPRLPVAYELVELGRVDSVMEEAARRAGEGAGEGTLIWATEQTDAVTRRGKRWHSPAGNLHCALIIEPDYDRVTAEQLIYVAAVSAGTALADLLEPMTGLRYRWPNHIFINDLKSGVVELRAEDDPDGYRWLVIGLSVNVAEHPPNPEPERFNSVHASGSPDVSVSVLLETYARHFLSWINRWADEGFGPVKKAWTMRADGIGASIALHLDRGQVEGVLREPDDQGRGVVESADGKKTFIGIGEYFSLGDAAR
ncbi:MAG: biotin--[acetyl-CoA-carboxylase] ligase [Gammaproteobacteria bacterium]|nr:biotin--[acetyl-CoA-carboxylase] ligase [Gammaproteobacteria bacterium]